MAIYHTKPIAINAWRYDHNLDIAKEGIPGLRHCVGTHGHVYTIHGEQQVEEGDYLVLHDSSELVSIMSADEFNILYE